MVLASLAGLPAFIAWFAASVALCVLFLLAYTWITPNREFDLVFREHNASAAVALGMSLLGFAIPLASAIFHAVSLPDCVIWGFVALGVQLLAYWLAALAHRDLGNSIRNNSMAAALWVGFVSVTAGLLSAACMSY